MNQLPQELIERICACLPRQDLRNVLTLTSKFRYAAERHSGAFAEFTVNESNSADFLMRFSSHRFLYLREVKFRPDVSAFYDVDDYTDDDKVLCRESAEEVRERDESFTRQIHFLFDILQLVETQAGEKHAPGRYRLTIYSPIRKTENKYACPHRYTTSWRVRLLNQDLPSITSIRSFEIESNASGPWSQYRFQYSLRDNWSETQESKLDLRVILDLATKMPNLEYLGVQTGGYEWCETLDEEEDLCSGHYEHDWAGSRRDARHDFAAAVSRHISELPKCLRRASLDFLYPLDRAFNIHHEKPLPDLVGTTLTHDPFTSSLSLLCSNLRTLRLRAMIDESLFPLLSPQDLASSQTCWPHLELLEILFHNAHPDGTWYFSGPAGQGHVARGLPVTEASYTPYAPTQLDEEIDQSYIDDWSHSSVRTMYNDQFRVAPVGKLMPLLEHFARAAINMPALKRAMIWSALEWSGKDPFHQGIDYWASPTDNDSDGLGDEHEKLAWGIIYTEPEGYGTRGPHRQLEWLVGKWRPGQEMHSLFQEIGRAKHGNELEELWTKGRRGKSFVSRTQLENTAERMFGFEDHGKCV
jgi:hypothetical protein